MLANINHVEAEALALPASQRAVLVQHLLTSLDEVDKQENERLWLDEAQRRYDAYAMGTLASRDAFEAIADMKVRL